MALSKLKRAFRDAAKGHGRAGTADWPNGPYMSMDDAAEVYARLATPEMPTVEVLKQVFRAGKIIGALFGSPDVPERAPAARKMVSGDIWNHSEHRFPEDCWGGGRTDCRRCGAYLNSFYDDEHGCRGPVWMRAFDGWDGGREE